MVGARFNWGYGCLLMLVWGILTATVGQARADEPIVITRSMRFTPGTHRIASSDELGKIGAVTIRGNGITVDFEGAILRGVDAAARPDERKGTGVLVQGKNITIRHLRAHGYKIGLIARNCPGLKLIDCDLSYNWKQHLLSTLEREDLADWMSYHHNEREEWLRYGAAAYLTDCDGFEVRNLQATGGQCGLMLVRSNHGLIWNCNLSFLSAIGIGLYRSSENRILHNKIDWCVRGYSHAVYNRGQDSAGILIYEQSNKNTFAYNSVTHGGDGFFLWAGQTTMDTGQGGCNDNIVFGNDFSHAPTNGIEATFSRNFFINNRVEECDHGVWGGYSYDTLILGNRFAHNNRAIAIEHGQHNRILANLFDQDGEAISLWQNKTQDPNWGYPKHHDTVSHDYKVSHNWIVYPTRGVFALRDTRDVGVTFNRIFADMPILKREGDTAGWSATNNFLTAPESALVGMDVRSDTVDRNRIQVLSREAVETRETGRYIRPAGAQRAEPGAAQWSPLQELIPGIPMDVRAEIAKYRPSPLAGAQNPFLSNSALRGRKYILVDEWGPYDFRSPVLWPRGKSVSNTATGSRTTYLFDVLGPKGVWKVKNSRGVESLSAQTGTVPGKLEITLAAGKAVDMNVELLYTGAETRDYRGIVTAAGKEVVFGYHQFFAPIDWDVRFFVYDKSTQEPRTQGDGFQKLIDTAQPVAHLHTDVLDYAGYGRFVPGVPANYFATIADGTFSVPEGDYLLEITSDDGCRVTVDGKIVLNEWKYQGPTTYTVPMRLSGGHKIHVEHFQIDGYATIKVRLRPGGGK